MLYILLLTTGVVAATARSSRARAHASAILPTDLHVGVHGHDASLLPDLRDEAVPAGKAARIPCSTRLAKASLAASARAAAAETADETMLRAQRALITVSRTKRRNLHKAEKRLAAASSPGSSDAATPVAKHAARDDAAGASGSAPCGGSPGIDTPSPYPFPSSTEAAAAVSSASSTQAAPPGAENEDTAHRASGIVIHKTTITKTNTAPVDFADILYVLVFFAIIIDFVAVVVKNSCIHSICVLVSLAVVHSVANALTSGSTVLSTRVSVADADARVRTASIPNG